MAEFAHCYHQYRSPLLQRRDYCLTFSKRYKKFKTMLESFFYGFNRLVNVKGLDVALICGNHLGKIKGDASHAGFESGGLRCLFV
ncbi:hypothetical protein FB480_103342 [Agrobacterium vitis]|nr:hypothetical protein FB480_103342 [Agrobacterium vitis]